MTLKKKYVIYILEKRRDDPYQTGENNSMTILIGPGDVWWYPYKDGYGTLELAEAALIVDRGDKSVILTEYRHEE